MLLQNKCLYITDYFNDTRITDEDEEVGGNSGFVERCALYVNQKRVHTLANLNLTISQSRKLFPPNVQLRILLKQAPDMLRCLFKFS